MWVPLPSFYLAITQLQRISAGVTDRSKSIAFERSLVPQLDSMDPGLEQALTKKQPTLSIAQAFDFSLQIVYAVLELVLWRRGRGVRSGRKHAEA